MAKQLKMDELVDNIIRDFENNKSPWESPWFSQQAFNWASGHKYRGINPVSLSYYAKKNEFTHSEWLTFNHVLANGGNVVKGSHGFPVFFYTLLEVKGKDNEKKKIPIMRTFIVFNIGQCEGIKPKETKAREFQPNELGEKILASSGIKVTFNDATSHAPAYYSKEKDTVFIPNKKLWKSDEAFYSTLFHELVHATGHTDRLNRETMKQYKEGDNRANEELIAELGGAFLSCFVGFKYETQHTSYLKHWASFLKDHKEALYKASSKAQKACDMILKTSGLMKADKEENKEEQETTEE